MADRVTVDHLYNGSAMMAWVQLQCLRDINIANTIFREYYTVDREYIRSWSNVCVRVCVCVLCKDNACRHLYLPKDGR